MWYNDTTSIKIKKYTVLEALFHQGLRNFMIACIMRFNESQNYQHFSVVLKSQLQRISDSFTALYITYSTYTQYRNQQIDISDLDCWLLF